MFLCFAFFINFHVVLQKNVSEFIISDMQRHSMGETRNSGIASDCSNDSYQSTASVRLEKEVNQLHLFYNEKALTIEEKLKNSFHVCFSSYYNFVHLIVDCHFFLYYSIYYSIFLFLVVSSSVYALNEQSFVCCF